MFIASIAIDFIWFFFIYLAIWATDDYNNLAGWERGIQKTCLVVAIINFVLKIASIALSFFFEPEVRSQMAPGSQPAAIGTQLR